MVKITILYIFQNFSKIIFHFFFAKNVILWPKMTKKNFFRKKSQKIFFVGLFHGINVSFEFFDIFTKFGLILAKKGEKFDFVDFSIFSIFFDFFK